MVSRKITCFAGWLSVKFASSARISLKEFWFTMGTLAIVVLCDTAAPLLVFTVPRIILKTSSLIASNWVSEHDGTDLGSLGGFWGLVKFSMVFCCCSTRANSHLISWLWAFTFSACWRCILERTDTCSWCVISSSLNSANCLSCSFNWAAWSFGSACDMGSSSNLLITWVIWVHMAWVWWMFLSRLSSRLLMDSDCRMLYLTMILSISSVAIVNF